MGFGDGLSFAVVPTRFKREDYKQTKHDSVFSKWQVLIGSNDWEDFRKGKDGVARYRVHNLPRRSCPGLYELGIVIIRQGQSETRSGRDVAKLDPDDVLVAYLGQADSVRTRLQRYGRSGAHLGNVNLIASVAIDLNDAEIPESPDKKAGLFEDIFSKGGSIVYRWAPMTSKSDAETTEALLLHTFDYAWNKGGNGERRPYDILKKLGDCNFMSRRITGLSQMCLAQKQIGIKIKGEKDILLEEKMLNNDTTGLNTTNLLSAIFKLSRSRPQLVSDQHETFGSDSGPVCGVILKDGTSCTLTPVKGRKRCNEHKGQRIFRVAPDSPPEKQEPCENSTRKDDKDSDTTCGVILNGGKSCPMRPVWGRKRCEEHKGMRINALLSNLNQTKGKTIINEKSSGGKCSDVNGHGASASLLCGARTKNGSFCTRSPSKGSRKCWQHMESLSGDRSLDNGLPACKSCVNNVVCGVKLWDGSVCERSPFKGRKRCEQHKGMRITS